MSEREPLIPKHGGYRNLKSFKVVQLVYDVTVRVCERYLNSRSRTTDQMVQAAQPKAFENEGGFTEPLYCARRARRNE